MIETLSNWLVAQGLGSGSAHNVAWPLAAVIVLLLAFVSNYIAKRFLLGAVSFLVKKSQTEWDDTLQRQKVFSRLSHLAPAMVIYASAQLFPQVTDIVERLSLVYMMLAGILVANSFLNAVVDIYRTFEISRQRPIKGYVQIAKVIIFVFVGIIAVGTLMDRSPWLLLSGLGAMTAVILLVFKDSILGLVASIQLSSNDMVRIGDWIEMPKYGADGDVVDVTLNTIKVQNWDKTITTIPAYALISDSFKNWRGMSESTGRRIKRAVDIDMATVKFCTPEMLQRFEKFELIAGDVKSKQDEVTQYNQNQNIDTSELINGRNLTNLGTFRAYLVAYLRHHPMIHQEMTFLVRQLPPGPNGLPIEIYVFSCDQDWVRYEDIQSDIFDHILAVIPEFDLRVFQHPTGHDFQAIAGNPGPIGG